MNPKRVYGSYAFRNCSSVGYMISGSGLMSRGCRASRGTEGHAKGTCGWMVLVGVLYGRRQSTKSRRETGGGGGGWAGGN